MGDKFIWLISENLSKTMDNNSYYFWKRTVEKAKDGSASDINAYLVLCKTKENVRKAKRLAPHLRSMIVWRNSLQHKKLYLKADMFFVTLSYKDITPDIYKGRHPKLKPLVYLQHGVIGVKRVGYKGRDYWNSIFRFVVYTKEEIDLLKDNNKFKEYQLYYTPAMPRYEGLAQQALEYKGKEDVIFWFLTWREYLSNHSAENFYKKIAEVVNDKKLKQYLSKNNKKLVVCFHALFDKKMLLRILQEDPNVEIVYASDIDVMNTMARSSMVITDYSSIGFDATFVGKPVLLYQFDSVMYGLKRNFYIDIHDDLRDAKVSSSKELIKQIVSEKNTLNSFFQGRTPQDIDLDEVSQGKYTDEMVDYFSEAQRNKVSFYGYNFYGRGGTVSATKSQAEALAEAGYMTELVSLKRTVGGKKDSPNGVVMRHFWHDSKRVKSRIKRHLGRSKDYSHLDIDHAKDSLIPYVGRAIRNDMASVKSRTIISTRESLHAFLADARNPHVKNKIYFFHTAPDAVEDYYPGIINRLRTMDISKAAFVTEASRKGYKELSLDGYAQHSIVGNALMSSQTVDIENIEAVDAETEVCNVVTLMRLTKERKADIDKILEFGSYLVSKGRRDIVVEVYGAGDYALKFAQAINDRGVESVIRYKGVTDKPHRVIRKAHCLVDFSLTHSFGMIYIEAILNGKMCYATDNPGSREVLNDVDGAIYSSWADLVKKITNTSRVSRDALIANHRLIDEKFGRTKVARAIIDLM